ncbi:MAG TPA: pilin [Gammaproteobacteria bacterium]
MSDAQAGDIRYFDASSRIGRVRYLAYPWGVILLALPVGILAGILFAVKLAVVGVLILICLEIFALGMSGVFIVRRLHDMDKSGWWSLIYWGLNVWNISLSVSAMMRGGGEAPFTSLLPTLLILVFFLVMVLLPGTQGENRFGPVPPPNSTWVLVGAWAWLGVIVLGGVIAALAIPAYGDFTARAQTSEAVLLAQGGKDAAMEYYMDKETWPAQLQDAYEAAAQSPAGRYTQSLESKASADGIEIIATFKQEGVSARIAGKSLATWTTDNGSTWHCGPGGPEPVETRDLPSSCRDEGAP